MDRDPFLTGRRLAFTACVVTALAAALAAVALKPGLPGGSSFSGRMAYIEGHHGVWVVGWLVRMAASLLVLGALIALSRTLTPGYPVLRTLSIQLLTVAVGAELLAGTLSVALLPHMAAGLSGGEAGVAPALRAVEGTAVVLSGVIGYGLLSLAGTLLCHAGWCSPPFPRWLAVMSAPVWGAGALAAGATLAGSASGTDLVLLLFLPLLALWMALLGSSQFRPPAGRR